MRVKRLQNKPWNVVCNSLRYAHPEDRLTAPVGDPRIPPGALQRFQKSGWRFKRAPSNPIDIECEEAHLSAKRFHVNCWKGMPAIVLKQGPLGMSNWIHPLRPWEQNSDSRCPLVSESCGFLAVPWLSFVSFFFFSDLVKTSTANISQQAASESALAAGRSLARQRRRCTACRGPGPLIAEAYTRQTTSTRRAEPRFCWGRIPDLREPAVVPMCLFFFLFGGVGAGEGKGVGFSLTPTIKNNCCPFFVEVATGALGNSTGGVWLCWCVCVCVPVLGRSGGE